MRVKLVVVGGESKEESIELDLPATLGRGSEVGLRLPHPLVSREHCELFEKEGRLFVRDLSSLNGTYVGNRKVDEQFLPPEELLTVGTVTFRAVYELVANVNDDTDAREGGDLTQRQSQTVVELGPINDVSADQESETDLRVDRGEDGNNSHIADDPGTRLYRPPNE